MRELHIEGLHQTNNPHDTLTRVYDQYTGHLLFTGTEGDADLWIEVSGYAYHEVDIDHTTDYGRAFA